MKFVQKQQTFNKVNDIGLEFGSLKQMNSLKNDPISLTSGPARTSKHRRNASG